MFEHMIDHDSGYTTYGPFERPSAVYWCGRGPEVKEPREDFERCLDGLAWRRYPANEVARWSWWRIPGTVEGVLVDGTRLGAMVEWIMEGVPTTTECRRQPGGWYLRESAGELEVAATRSPAGHPALAIRRAGGRLGVLVALDATSVEDPPGLAEIGATAHQAIFGPPQPALWFDEEGSGPIDGIEYQVMGWSFPKLEPRVALEPIQLYQGGGSLTANEARELARQLNVAADWCDARTQVPEED